jgi:hypothetical protein
MMLTRRGRSKPSNAKGERLIWLDVRVANRFAALRGPGEGYSNVILHCCRRGDEGAGSKNRRLSERISNRMMAQIIAASTTKNRMFLMGSILLGLRSGELAVQAATERDDAAG